MLCDIIGLDYKAHHVQLHTMQQCQQAVVHCLSYNKAVDTESQSDPVEHNTADLSFTLRRQMSSLRATRGGMPQLGPCRDLYT